MNAALVHLLFVVGGMLVAFLGLYYFARVSGAWSSLAGVFTIAFLIGGIVLVLVGFGALPFPGIGVTT